VFVVDGFKFADILNGDLSKEMSSLTSQNTQMQQRSTRVIERAEAYRDRLIDKYANFESRLAAAQTVLAQLRSLLGTNNEDN
jgi:hypothetical protein